MQKKNTISPIVETYAAFAKDNKGEKIKFLKKDEIILSKNIQKARNDFWFEVFGYPAWIDGICSFIEEHIYNLNLDEIDFSNIREISPRKIQNWKNRQITEQWNQVRKTLSNQISTNIKLFGLIDDFAKLLKTDYLFGKKPSTRSKRFIRYKNQTLSIWNRLQNLKQKFFKANIALAIREANKFAKINPSISFDDLLQEAMIGLMVGIERFDWKKDVKFSTYGILWIKHYVRRFIDNNSSSVRVSVGTAKKLKKIHDAVFKLKSQNKEIVAENIKKITGYSTRIIEDVLSNGRIYVNPYCEYDVAQPGILDDNYISQYVDDSLSTNTLILDSHFDKKKAKNCLLNSIEKLPPELRFIINERFNLHEKYEESPTLQDVGKIRGCSRERIRQLQVIAIQQLKEMMEKKGVKSWDLV